MAGSGLDTLTPTTYSPPTKKTIETNLGVVELPTRFTGNVVVSRLSRRIASAGPNTTDSPSAEDFGRDDGMVQDERG